MRWAQACVGAGSEAWPRLLADIGGTNARFAWRSQPSAPMTHRQVLACADFAGPAEAIRAYLRDAQVPMPKSAALAMAVPVVTDWVQMTNSSWAFSIEALCADLGLQKLLVLNDFTALALALPTLGVHQLHDLGPALAGREGPLALLGAGTGLGVSGLLQSSAGSGWVPIMGEGGHVSLAASNDLEFAVIRALGRQYGHVSAERVLSGSGLVDVHQVLSLMQGRAHDPALDAAQVVTLGLQASDGVARQTLDLFCGWLGSVAGDLALTLGAVGGVYVGGGIAPRLREHLARSSFRERFVAKGRYRAYLEAIPTRLIVAETSPALEGASLALELLAPI